MATNRFKGRRLKSMKSRLLEMMEHFDWMVHLGRVSARSALVLAAIFTLGFIVYTAVLDSPYFLVRHVSIQTIPQLSESDVLIQAGLDAKTNIFSVDAAQVERDLMQHPWVSRAEVVKRLPNRVDVILQERRPTGVVALKDFYLVDGEGVPFVKASLDQVQSFPVVTGLNWTEFARQPVQFKRQVRHALAVVRLYERIGVQAGFPAVGEVHIGDAQRISLMAGRTRIGLGTDDFETKLGRLEKVFATLKSRKVSADYILFGDTPSRVVVRERVKKKSNKPITLNVSGA
ncbi:MAG: FtsQ-type POTRA domain-containing protein [Myxococcota bacterium]|nr:FtsQ-type POTRA domain-containing protein [Myxococcota bacterium]